MHLFMAVRMTHPTLVAGYITVFFRQHLCSCQAVHSFAENRPLSSQQFIAGVNNTGDHMITLSPGVIDTSQK
jgi:hypothetical protein